MLVLVVVIGLLTIAGNFAVEIILNNPQYITPCAKDLRNGTDNFVLAATYGPDIVVAQAAGWKDVVSPQILISGSTKFTDICIVFIGTNGSYCGQMANQDCRCEFLDANGAAHVIVNISVPLSYSKGIVRWEWQNSNRTYFYSDNITLPHIYDVTTAALELTVNNHADDSCSESFTTNEDNIVELCCSNTASPCYPRMSFSDGVIIDNQKTCGSRTFKSVNANFTVNVTFSYSVCTSNDYITRYSCQINTNIDKTTTASPNNSTAGSEPKRKKPDNTGAIVGGIIGGLCGAALIALVVFLVCKKCACKVCILACCKRCTKDKEVARETPNNASDNNGFVGDTPKHSDDKSEKRSKNGKNNKNNPQIRGQEKRNGELAQNAYNNPEQVTEMADIKKNNLGLKPGGRSLPPLKGHSTRPTSIEVTSQSEKL